MFVSLVRRSDSPLFERLAILGEEFSLQAPRFAALISMGGPYFLCKQLSPAMFQRGLAALEAASALSRAASNGMVSVLRT